MSPVDPRDAVQAQLIRQSLSKHADMQALALELVELLLGHPVQEAAVSRLRALCRSAPDPQAVYVLGEFLEARALWEDAARLARIR